MQKCIILHSSVVLTLIDGLIFLLQFACLIKLTFIRSYYMNTIVYMIGDPGSPGSKGEHGTKGNVGLRGDSGDRGPRGLVGKVLSSRFMVVILLVMTLHIA